jgi:hypothetical protein
MARKGENYMDVASRKQFPATCCDPTVAGSGLTFWTMPVATTVVGDGGPMPAVGALVEVTAKRGGATARNGPQHFDMLPADPPTASLDEAVSRSTDEIGNFQYGPVHLLALQHQHAEIAHGNPLRPILIPQTRATNAPFVPREAFAVGRLRSNALTEHVRY